MALAELVAGTLLYGLLLGVIYGIATAGLSLIFGVLKIVNVGHGAFIMIGAYVTYWLYTLYGLNPIISVPLSLAVGAALGLVFYYPVIRRVIGAPEMASLLATFAIGLLLQEAARMAWTADYRGFTWEVARLEVAGVSIYASKFIAASLAIGLLALHYIVFYRTRLGLAIRAVVQDREGALVVGINVDRIYALSFAIGIAITVASGSLLAMYNPVGINPYMGTILTLKAFVIAVMGGLGSIEGAFLAGVLFGLFENASYVALTGIEGVQPLVLTRFIAFTLLLIILLVRPRGLFGKW